MQLDPKDERHLNAAQGYAMLQMYSDAEEELRQLSRGLDAVPEVLIARLLVYQGLKKWEGLRSIALQLMALQPGNSQWPISLAYATRRCDSIEVARNILVVAQKKHPNEAIIPYNIACYDCQLGNLESAKGYLEHAIQLSPKIKPMAMEDEDLKPLWETLR
jgi:tetratricopeptide (TPR) repeat protein